ncbi:MAG: phosphoenolpyruvate--protein phosphotransferase [Candidatus Izemoplasmataceae bacterium]
MNTGFIASKGFAIGKVFRLEKQSIDFNLERLNSYDEAMRYIKKAKSQCINDLEKLKLKLNEEESAIFDAHIEMINDPQIQELLEAALKDNSIHPAIAYKNVTDTFISLFKDMEDTYFKQRASDIEDIQHRMLLYLTNQTPSDLSNINEDTIIVAKDLTPSDTASLDYTFVKGFITEDGGYTSHTAIMARSLMVPAIIGVKDILKTLKNDDVLILDAINHNILVNPNQDIIIASKNKLKLYLKSLENLKSFTHKKTLTKDNISIPLLANIGSLKDLPQLSEVGAEGIGLFRTEFLFMDSMTMPDEETQLSVYEKVFKSTNTVIVRTLDIGGDKNLPYLNLEKEENPFLGVRAIRLCLQELDLFKTQLRALLRAATVTSEIHIMFPMIARVDELDRAIEVLNKVIDDLRSKKIEFQEQIKIGIMIEIPSAALNARELAKKVDFFSIGTNDLIQYTYAADRMNDKLNYLYDPLDPTLLRLIQFVITEAHKEETLVGVCGEMAGDLTAALILIGMGIDELSMNTSSILQIRKVVKDYTLEELISLTENALKLNKSDDVKKLYNH